MRVLVVEDEELMARTWRRVLKFDGHEVLTAASCAEAAALMREASGLGQQLEVVILDQRLPDGQGSSLLGPLALHQPGAGVAVVSAYLESHEILPLIRYGAVPVPKPLSMATMQELVRMLRPSPEAPMQRTMAFAQAHGLSPRESQTLRSGVLGLTASQAADEMGCAEKTLSTYWCRIFQETGLSSQRDVIAAALGARLGASRAAAT